MNIVKKITVKGVMDDKIPAPEKGKPKALCHVFGVVRSAKGSSTTFGPYIRFSGTFEAINLETGEQFHSGTLILPGIAESLLFGACGEHPEASVEFAFEIGVKASNSPVKYDFTVKSLIDQRGADPLKALRDQTVHMRPGLPAPSDSVSEA